jgi:hypothetical protein
VIWFVVIVNLSANVLSDSVTALGFLIALYYGLTGVACAIYYRRELRRSLKNFVLLGLAPLLGGVMLCGIFIKALVFYGHAENTASPPVFGIGGGSLVVGVGPLVVGVGSLVVGVGPLVVGVGSLVVGVGSLVVGVILMAISGRSSPSTSSASARSSTPAVLAAIDSGG